MKEMFLKLFLPKGNVALVEGGHILRGVIEISGGKNASLPCLAASILSAETSTIENIPFITDIGCMLDILTHIGSKVVLHESSKSVSITPNVACPVIPSELSKRMRASTLLLGSLLATYGYAKIEGYGGCPIGKRPIDLHLRAFKLLGAKITMKENFIEVSARKLKGAKINFNFPSVGATENALLASCMADGKTILTNVAIEPEVLDLVNMLKAMGADIVVDVNKRTIIVNGCRDLEGCRHRVIPDRIEVGTYAVASAITYGNIQLCKLNTCHIAEVIKKLVNMGVTIDIISCGHIRVIVEEEELRSTDIITRPYPGFPTDMQPQFTSLATKARGTSYITETIYENRFLHVPELKKMGAKISIVDQRTIAIKGPTILKGSSLHAKDIRGGMALVLAALSAQGVSYIDGVEHIWRGYENFIEKLEKVGAKVRVIDSV